MPIPVALAVLAAALFHASWNAIVRVKGERILVITLITTGAGLLAIPLLPVFGLPASPAWPWLLASVALHLGYNSTLALAYGHGDLTGVYPLARGAAPLFVLVVSAVMGETVSGLAVASIVLLAGGIILLALEGGIAALWRKPTGAGLALLTALFIAGYTVADGNGARLAGSPHAYALWLFLLDAVPLLVLVLAFRPRALRRSAAMNWRPALAASFLSLAAYWIVIWAMTVAPIPLVAALRETSVIFAVLIGTFILGERVTPVRVASPLIMLAGLALIRLG